MSTHVTTTHLDVHNTALKIQVIFATWIQPGPDHDPGQDPTMI